MYRALEQLDEPIIVLHGLEYTHKQLRMWDFNHDEKHCSSETNKGPSCKNKTELNKTECEHDFVVIGPNYIVNIEVKNPRVLQKPASKTFAEDPLSGPLKSAKKQHDKVVELERGIATKTQGQCGQTIDLVQLVAFPKLDHRNIFHGSDDSEIKSVLINKSHLENFKSFWNERINGRNSIPDFNGKTLSSHLANKECRIVPQCSISGDFKKIQRVLFHLFAIKPDNEIEKIKISLSHCVVDIDQKLRDGTITFESENEKEEKERKNRKDQITNPRNPAVLETSTLPSTEEKIIIDGKNVPLNTYIIKDCLGLNFITKEQWEAYQKESDSLIITGCPGSGKTWVLLARIIRLALTDKHSKIKLSVGNHIDLVKYKPIFEKVGIKAVEETYAASFDLESRLIIAHRPTSVSNYKFDYEFIDDYQVQPCETQSQYPHQKPWVLTVDLNQKPQTTTAEKVFQYCGSSYDIVRLSASYRNTRNVVTQLITLRELIGNRAVQTENQTEEIERLAHTPAYGHFIHGPQILVQIYHQDAIEYFHRHTIEEIFKLKIKGPKIECAFFFFPRFFHRIGIKDEWVLKYYDSLFTESETDSEFFSSSEFTQCHILLPFDPKDYTASLQFLYNAISRARVLCHVHVLVNKTYIRDEVDEKLRIIFPEARIIYE